MVAHESAPENFLVMAHGPSEEMARAKAILAAFNPSRLDQHEGEIAK
jgi:hypothetical protein